ncbi:non-canonical purine NTP diphosphatase [Reichenbachiella versicolor]|uniref:non-canonical purine NTP diphosphatase n=1 Tax=Reichenbachiella versicolor TaxID=1821036 RepID=UPI000D6DDFB0|nr:non-canonical purine NTP diphosphatase [Reichenbachiella versicolor]
MKICFATHNQNKLKEINQILGNDFEVVGLTDIGCTEEIIEDGNTLEENSAIKARHVFSNYNIPCFADDTGLEVESLGGAPGVYSARYAGEPSNSQNNIKLLLQNLDGESNRTARFRTVITLIWNSEEIQFEGIVRGAIADSLKGTDGFGYDPIFIPEGQSRTFSEMSSNEKNAISHRGRAVAKLVDYLKSV